jgi:hypothetical protein
VVVRGNLAGRQWSPLIAATSVAARSGPSGTNVGERPRPAPRHRAFPGPAATRRDLAGLSSTVSVTIRVRRSCWKAGQGPALLVPFGLGFQRPG